MAAKANQNNVRSMAQEDRPKVIEQDKYYWKYNAKYHKYVPISNFTISSKIMIQGEEESMRILTISSKEKISKNLVAPYQVFLSKKNFAAFIEKFGNYFFKGTDNDLVEIKEMVFSGCNYVEHIEKLGYNKKNDCFVLANGIIKEGYFYPPDPLGIVQGLFIPTSTINNVHNKNIENQKNYVYKDQSTLDLNAFIRCLKEAYDEYKVMMGIAFIISSTCFDYISKVLGFFPFLNPAGQPSSGKSTFAKILLAPFTTNPDSLMLENVSATGFMRKLEQTCNIPVIFDEYKNSLSNHKQEAIKNIYDIKGKTVGVKTNDSSTKQSKILSPLILSGEEIPTGNSALMKRILTLIFLPLKNGDKDTNVFHFLEQEIEKGLGKVLIEILDLRKHIIENFQIEYLKTIEKLQVKIKQYADLNKEQLVPDTRLVKNYACILACLIIAVKKSKIIILDNDDSETVCDKILNQAVLNGISQQTKREKSYDDVTVFWQIIESLISKYAITQDRDYLVDRDNDIFAITARVLDEYQKYGREINGKPVRDKGAIIDYFKYQSYYIDYKKKYFDNGGKKKQIRCYKFHLSALESLGFALD